MAKAMTAQEAHLHLREREGAYKQTLGSPIGQIVLKDLAEFCRANASCFDPDPRIHAVAEGRREVWLRIQSHLNLTAEDLYALYTGRTFNPLEQDKVDDNG